MTILLLLFVIYIISTLRTKKDDTFLSKSQTRTINGIMSYLIFMSHFIQYIDNKDFIYNRFQSYMGQLVVAPFLAFSGYGIMLSIEKKGKPYIVSLIKKRFVNIWLRFAGIVLLFLVVDQFTGNQYPLSTILLSFVAWESIGNSNWYVLAILILYVITYISFIKIPPSKYIYSIATLTFFCLLYALILRQAGKGSWYYDTIIAYPIGMLISYYRDQIMRICDKKRPFIFLTTSSIIIFTIITLLNRNCSVLLRIPQS